MDNAFAAVQDIAGLQGICDRLGPEQIGALLRKWLAILAHPFTPADRAAGYRYEVSVLQAEFSLTQMLDRPVSGRVFFENVIRENLDIAPPGPGQPGLRPEDLPRQEEADPGTVQDLR